MSKEVPVGEEEVGWPMVANEIERMELTSIFIYLFWLLKDDQPPCCPRNSTGMHVFEADAPKPIPPD